MFDAERAFDSSHVHGFALRSLRSCVSVFACLQGAKIFEDFNGYGVRVCDHCQMPTVLIAGKLEKSLWQVQCNKGQQIASRVEALCVGQLS